MVNGDSHIKRIKWNLINNSFGREKSYVKLARKSSRPQALHYPVTSRPKKRDIAVIQIGGSDIIILQVQKM